MILKKPRGRVLAIATAVVFFISTAFPATAGLSRNTAAFPKWWGALDIASAALLAILAFAVVGLAQGKVDKQAVYCVQSFSSSRRAFSRRLTARGSVCARLESANAE